jgi:hypothetical protein
MATVDQARIVDAQYSLSELISMQDRIVEGAGHLAGLSVVAASIPTNRVRVGFRDATFRDAAFVQLTQTLGLPADALTLEVTGEAISTADWHDYIQTTRAGLHIQVQGAPFSGSYGGTHGYVVRASTGENLFLTSSHTVNAWRGVNGATGDSIWQPTRLKPLLGTTKYN